jgi:hypothetical protein
MYAFQRVHRTYMPDKCSVRKRPVRGSLWGKVVALPRVRAVSCVPLEISACWLLDQLANLSKC